MTAPSGPYRLAYSVSHPIQFQTAAVDAVRGRRAYCKRFFYSDFLLVGYHDQGIARAVQWEVPLMRSYRHTFLSRVAESWEPWKMAARAVLAENFPGAARGALRRRLSLQL